MRGVAPAVVMPYTQGGQYPEAEAALRGYDPVMADVSHSDEAYWGLLAGLWHKGETFVVVEHDVVVPPNAIDELLACSRPWCSFVVEYFVSDYAGLSCAKFEISCWVGLSR